MFIRFLFTLSVVFLGSCNKEQKLVNRLEGKWKVDKILLPNGSYRTSDSIFTFTKGEAGNQNLLTLNISWNSNTLSANYYVEYKKDVLEFSTLANGIKNTFKVQDQDDKNIYAYSSLDYGIYFFKKVD